MTDDGQVLRRPRGQKKRSRMRSVLSSSIGALILVALAVAGVWVVNNPQPIIDRVTVWQYEPSSVVSGHADRLQLTEHGRFLYYASQPVVSSADAFTTQCPSKADEATFGILGCYVHSSKTIYLFDVTDPRLDGAEEVVAAHEMLHAAWDRLGADQKQNLEGLLEIEYSRLSHNDEFSERMAFYGRTEPGQRANELHSIIGTEATDISPELEEYYARYFEGRGAVTGLHSSSHGVFVQLQEQADSLVAQLDALRLSTENDYARYLTASDDLNQDVLAHNRKINFGYFTDQQAADRSSDALNTRRENLDALFDSIQDRVGQYEALAAELTQVNVTSAELQRGLNIGGKADVAPEPN